MNDILKKLQDENEAQYIFRIGSAKENGLITDTWESISPILNQELGYAEEDWKGECAWRKRYRNYKEAYEQIFSKQQKQFNEIESQIRELEKAKIKLRDERTDYQKSIREAARRESFIEMIERVISKQVESFDYKSYPIIDNNEDMVVCLSDLHAGITISNYWNDYNINILRLRLHKYLNEIISIQKLHQCKVCNIVLGGDNVSGLIHPNLRLQNNENVIEQVKIATTYIGDFIYELESYFEKINVHSVSGNHSRISPNKEDHLKGEELDALIPFCLSLKFANNSNVEICDASIDKTIGMFTTRGNKVFYIVHGDKDVPSQVVKNMTLMTDVKPDGIIMGHRHHNAYNTEYGVKVIQCGCVVGTDDHCVDLRISGEPEQCVIITSDRRTVKCFYDIGL